jgi:flagellar motor switch protein FliN
VSWENLAWRPADASNPEGIAPLLSEAETIKSALEEAVAAMVMGPVTITGLDVTDVETPADLPDDFAIVATFELLGKGRLPLGVAIDPSGGDRLAGTVFDIAELGRRLAEELDAVVGFIAGEGLQVGAPDGAAFPPDEKLVLLRLTLSDADGGEARIVAAVHDEVPADLGMHLILVKEMGKITLEPPNAPKPAPAAPVATPDPAAAPVAAQALDPMAAYAAIAQAGYPAQPGYPQMPGGYPGQGGYPQMPGAYPGYPQMPGAYPQMPGMAPGGQGGFGAAAYPPNIRPLSLDELGGGMPSGPGSSMDLLYGVNLEVTVEIGRTRMPIRDVLALTPGSIVELDKLAGEKVDVLVNGHLIASGEVVVVDEENFGVRITDVSSRARRLAMAEGAA